MLLSIAVAVEVLAATCGGSDPTPQPIATTVDIWALIRDAVTDAIPAAPEPISSA